MITSNESQRIKSREDGEGEEEDSLQGATNQDGGAALCHKRKTVEDLPQEFLKEILRYDPITGFFFWKIRRSNGVNAGDRAGSLMRKLGYIRISIHDKSRSAHRLAWIMHYGFIPRGMQVDHRNRIRHDNRISNLRLATHAQNGFNRKLSKNNISGYSGVDWSPRLGKWRATIKFQNNTISLGFFFKKEDAIQSRGDAELKYFGEFSSSIPIS